jgi:hypothetical protein
MNAVFGLGWYLVANWILFCIPLAVFYFLLRGKRWAYTLAQIYAAVMILNGIGHNAATILTGRYFNGFAGGITGIGLLLAGMPLFYALWKAVRRGKADEPA